MRVIITARGLNVAYHMSRLCDMGVVLYDVVKIDNKHLQLVCSSSNSAKVVQYLTDNNFFDIIINTMGFYRVLLGMRRYVVLVSILLLIVPVLWINSLFCSGIVVSGDIDSDTVLDCLRDTGVSVGCRLGSIQYDKVEDYLSSQLDLSYTIVDIVGNKIYVSTVDNVDIPTTDYSQPRDIVAQHSGTITSISVVQGTAVVSVGQYVNAGDVLIRGIRTYTDGSTTPVYAIGTVKAEVSVTSTVPYTGYYDDYSYTGNSATIVRIDIANSVVYGSHCPYQCYDVDSTTVTMYPLALTVTYCYYTEKLPTTVAISYNDYLADMQQQALQQAMAKVYFAVDNTIYNNQYNNSVTVKLVGSIVISDNSVASMVEDK